MPGIAPCSKNRGLMDIGVHHVTLPHPPKCYSLLAGLRCPRAARHSTAWCKWGALCKWSNIFATSVRGSHTTFLFHPSWLFFFFFPLLPFPQPPLLEMHIHLTVPKIIDSNPNINILKQNHWSHFSFHNFMISTHYHNHHLHKGKNISVLKFIFSVS